MSSINVFSKLALLGIAILSFDTFAGPAKQSFYGESLDKEILRLQGFRSSTSGDLNAPKACKARYNKIFGQKYVNVSIGLGYGDNDKGDVAIDSIMYKDLVNKLTQRCPYGISACGFSRVKNEVDTFRRIVEAPTGENNYMVTIKITRPSLSWNGTDNTGAHKAAQLAACSQAKAKFMGEVAAGADVAFYIGHSRNGGGPDFCPAKRDASGHIDYPYYQAKKEGITALANAMKAAAAKGKPNQVVGSFSCSSEMHFASRLKAANPKAGLLLTSRTVQFDHMLIDAYTSLDSVLHQRCADGYTEAYEYRQFGTNLVNMF